VSQIQEPIAQRLNAKPNRVIKEKKTQLTSTENTVGEQPIKSVSLINEDQVLALTENPREMEIWFMTENLSILLFYRNILCWILRDRYEYEFYDQFSSQIEPMITNDCIGNYNFLVDFNPYPRISSCDHYSKEEDLNICEYDQQYMQVMIEGSWEFYVR